MTWRLVDHTADVAIEAEAPDAGGCLDQAALALTSVITGEPDPRALGAETELRFAIEAPDDDSLLVAFLAELLWQCEAEDLLWTGGGVTVTDTPDGLRRADAAGNAVRFDQALHGRGVEVKAVTYHDLHFRRDGPQWSARVLLDI